MTSKTHNGTAYTIRKTEDGRFSACAKIEGQLVEVRNDKRRVAEACIKGHIDDAKAE